MSDIYLFDNPLDYVGVKDKIQKLNRSDLLLKEECTVYLIKKGVKIVSGKNQRECL